jgi:hypothetical protein
MQYIYMYITLFCGSREVGMGGWRRVGLDDAFLIKQALLGLGFHAGLTRLRFPKKNLYIIVDI